MTELAAGGVAEATELEAAFLAGLEEAQGAYERIVATRAWAALGFDSFAAWWDERVAPTMRALSMKPTREIAAAVIEQVRQEEAALPSTQRRTQRELAEMVGIDRSTLANRDGSRSARREESPQSDLAEPTSLGQSPMQTPTVVPPTTVSPSAEPPGPQDLVDAFLAVVDGLASAPAPREIHTAPPLDFHDIAADTVQRWRLNFATARLKARELTTFDPERINEVHSGNWDREVGDILGALETWIAQVRDARRDQQKTKLRLVGGGRA